MQQADVPEARVLRIWRATSLAVHPRKSDVDRMTSGQFARAAASARDAVVRQRNAMPSSEQNLQDLCTSGVLTSARARTGPGRLAETAGDAGSRRSQRGQPHDQLRSLASPVAVRSDLAAMQPRPAAARPLSPIPRPPGERSSVTIALRERAKTRDRDVRGHPDAVVSHAHGPPTPGSRLATTSIRPPGPVYLAALVSQVRQQPARSATVGPRRRGLGGQGTVNRALGVDQRRTFSTARAMTCFTPTRSFRSVMRPVRDARHVEQVVDSRRADRSGPGDLQSALAVHRIESSRMRLLQGAERVSELVHEHREETRPCCGWRLRPPRERFGSRRSSSRSASARFRSVTYRGSWRRR